MIRFRFRLATLFVLMTLCCLMLGFGVVLAKRVNAQRQFIAYLFAEYGPNNKPTVYVRYAHEVDEGQPYFGHPFPRSFLSDVLHRIVEVRFHNLDIADDPDNEAKMLSQFQSLEIVEIQGISDVGAAHLARLRKLESLEIGISDLTDRGLTELAKLPRLKHLDIRNASNHVTVEAVARFRTRRPDVALLEDAWWTEEAESRARQVESGADLHETSKR